MHSCIAFLKNHRKLNTLTMGKHRKLYMFLGQTVLYFVILLGLLYFLVTLVRVKEPLFIMSSSLKEKKNRV